MKFRGWFQRREDAASANGESKAHRRIRRALIVLLALDAALLFMIIRPPVRSWMERKAILEREKAQHADTLSTVRQMRDLRAKLQTAIQTGREFSQEHFLQRQTAFSSMVADLEQMASQNKLKTTGISYGLSDNSKQENFVDVEVGITVEGQYPDLVRFVSRLEQSQLFWIIDSLNVSTSAASGLRLSLRLGTFAVSA